MANTFASWDPASGISQNDFLYQQIAAQKMAGLGNWSGGLDPETSMRSMAMDLEKSGITSLGQIGWNDKLERSSWEGIAPGGTVGAYDRQGIGMDNTGAESFGGYTEDDPLYGRWTSGLVNKDTGKQLHSAYGERTAGNTWSGSYAGKGNTGFDISFDAEGNPVFGTHGASSVRSKDWLPGAMLLAGGTMAAAPLLLGAAGGTGAGSGAFLGEGVASGVGAWDAAAGLGALGTEAGVGAGTGAELFSNTGWLDMAGGAGMDAVETGGLNGAFLGEGVTSGIPAWDAASAGVAGSSSWIDGLTKALGYTNADGSLNKAALLKSLMSVGSGLYGMNQAGDLSRLSQQAISGSAPWTTSGGTAMAGEELKRAISGDLSGDPGFKLAQQAAARASSQQPGGMAASAAAMAALKYQNDRIGALSGPAGVGFNPAAGYQTGLAGQGAANSLASSSLGSIGFGTTSSDMPPWLQQFLIKNGMGA